MKIKSLFLLCFTLIVSTQLYGSAGQAALAAQTACAEPAAAQKQLSFPVGKDPHSLFFLKDGSRLGVGNLGEKPVTVTVFDVDRETGMLREIAGSPFEISKSPVKPSQNPSSAIYSPNGKWNVNINLLADGEGGAYSPDNRLLALTNGNSLFMYEVDQETGKQSLITGKLLKVVRQERKKEYQEAYKALVEPEPSALNPDVATVLKKYVVGPDEKTKKEPQK